tara:strand:- start:831 stop:1067 length:237 start_codon:yes stop_codon:yes gene_type:complete
MNENYLALCIDEVYDLITDKGHWPKNFDTDMKSELIGHMQKYYEQFDTVEAYKRCASLQKHLNDVLMETTGSNEKILN